MNATPPESAQELLEGLAGDLGVEVRQTARRETIYGGSSQAVRVVGLDGDAADVVRPEDELCVAAQNDSTETAVPGVSQSDLAPVTDMTAHPADVDMTIAVDGGAPTAVVFAWAGCVNGGLVAAEMQLKIQALGAEFAAVTVAYIGVAPDDVYRVTSGTVGRESTVVITNGAPNNCADHLKLGLTNGGAEWTGFEDYHIPITDDAATPTAPRCSAFRFTVTRHVTCSAIELMVRHDSVAYPEGSFWVALYSGATADVLVRLGVFGALEGARVPWSEYSLIYLGLLPGVAEIDLVPGTNYWIGICGGDPTNAAPPADEQWRDASLWVMKSIDGAVGLCAVDTNGDHRPEDWGPGDFALPANVNPWFRLYQRKTVLRAVPASPHVVLPSVGEPAVMERVGGAHPHRQISGARGGLSSAGAYGRGASGAGAASGAGNLISAAAPLVAGEVVYATGPSTVDSNAGFTFDPGTGIAYATALQTAQNLGIPADPDLVQFLAANEVTVNGKIELTPAVSNITANTADASDNHQLIVCGGGTYSDTRGGFIQFIGNEATANNKGGVVVKAGNIATGGTYDGHILFYTNSLLRLNLLDDGNLEHRPNADAIATFGRVKVGFVFADHAAVGHFDHFALASVGFRQAPTGYTVLNAVTGQLIYFRINNTGGIRMSAAALYPTTDSAMTLGLAAGPKYFLNVFTDVLTLFPSVTISGGAGGMGFAIPAGDSYSWGIGGVMMTRTNLELSVSGTINTTVSFEVNGTKILGNQGAALGDLAVGADWDTVGRPRFNMLLSRLRGSTGHGVLAG